jgi:diacylglycerol kinase (ATP)
MSASAELIVNPRAARLRRRPRLAARIRELAAGRARVHVTGSLTDLDVACRGMLERRPEFVVLCGGDGTFMAGVSALARAFGSRPLPALVFAPAGTVATVARNLGQKSELIPTVRRALDSAPLPPARPRPTLRVAESGGATRVGFIFGTGLVARFFEHYYAAGAGGYGAAARIVARVFAGSFVGDAYSRGVLDPLPCTLCVDGRALGPSAYSLIASSVVRDLGLHLWVTHRAGEDFQRPHLVASPLPPRRLGPQAPRVLLGKSLRGAENFDDLVTRFAVRFPDGHAGPYVLDGDMLHAPEVEVSAGPAIRVIAL